MEESIA
jgi:hypothetical protein